MAVAVSGATAYPSGLDLEIAVRRRHGHFGFEDPFELYAFGERRDVQPNGISPKLLRLGVQFSDGRKATSVDQSTFLRGPDEEPEGPVLTQGGGGGGGGQWDGSFWLWPLPPSGALAFVCEWPSEGIELTRMEIDAGVVLEAAEQAEVLWEDGGSNGSTQSYNDIRS